MTSNHEAASLHEGHEENLYNKYFELTFFTLRAFVVKSVFDFKRIVFDFKR